MAQLSPSSVNPAFHQEQGDLSACDSLMISISCAASTNTHACTNTCACMYTCGSDGPVMVLPWSWNLATWPFGQVFSAHDLKPGSLRFKPASIKHTYTQMCTGNPPSLCLYLLEGFDISYALQTGLSLALDFLCSSYFAVSVLPRASTMVFFFSANVTAAGRVWFGVLAACLDFLHLQIIKHAQNEAHLLRSAAQHGFLLQIMLSLSHRHHPLHSVFSSLLPCHGKTQHCRAVI